MPTFLAERDLSRDDLARFALEPERARRGAAELSREATSVQFLRSLFVPEEETCFHVCDAPSADAVCEAARRATLTFERVSAAIADTERGATGPECGTPTVRRGAASEHRR